MKQFSYMHRFLVLFMLVMLPLLSAPVQAEQTRQQALFEQLMEEFTANPDANLKDTVDDPARPVKLPAASTDPKTLLLYEKALQDYYSYRSEGLQHRKAVFKWQLFSAKLIFVIVLILVASGLVFAAIQFRQGLNDSKRRQSSDIATDVSTEVEISGSGIKLSSPVLGVIILALSLAFFYLYLVYVYPVENIF